MKLGTLANEQDRDGDLIVVSRDGTRFSKVPEIAKSLRLAIENWATVKDRLAKVYDQLNDNDDMGEQVDETKMHSPLPRAFQWADGSAFLHHVALVRKSRNAEMPDRLYEVPLMYQGGSDCFLAPREDIPQVDFSHGTDFEGEVGVITDYIPMGSTPEECMEKILLLVIINDVSLRGLIPEELKAGFGFFHGKPPTAFAPFAVTPDELGEHWKDGRIHLPLNVDYNGSFFGKANGKAMHFSFGQLLAHACRTRPLMAGTLIGSGTVSNDDPEAGSSCILERRMIEKIEEGAFKTPFMKEGDTVKISMSLPDGQNVFGTIEQKVVKA